MNRTTTAREIHFSGVGLHTGVHATVTLRPATSGVGLCFLLGGSRIPAIAECVIDTSRATVIGHGERSVSTVEHLLSALYASGITDLEIEVEGPEIPVLDGSAKEFISMLVQTGTQDLGTPAVVITPTETLTFAQDDRLVVIIPARTMQVRFVADFPAPIGTQYRTFPMDSCAYATEIASARTFGYLHEVEALRARGLALGGSLENALVFDTSGPMQPLQWPDEVVRHKILDLLGDFALLGAYINADILAIKSGHALNSHVTKALRERYITVAGSV